MVMSCGKWAKEWDTNGRNILGRVVGLSLSDWVRSTDVRRAWSSALLLCIETSQLRWFRHLVRMPPRLSLFKCLPGTTDSMDGWMDDLTIMAAIVSSSMLPLFVLNINSTYPCAASSILPNSVSKSNTTYLCSNWPQVYPPQTLLSVLSVTLHANDSLPACCRLVSGFGIITVDKTVRQTLKVIRLNWHLRLWGWKQAFFLFQV